MRKLNQRKIIGYIGIVLGNVWMNDNDKEKTQRKENSVFKSDKNNVGT